VSWLQLDPGELSTVSQRMPVWSLSAQVERQTTDAVVGKLVSKHEGNFAAWIEFVSAESSSNASITPTNNQKLHNRLFMGIAVVDQC
jgi:hypothetical protein